MRHVVCISRMSHVSRVEGARRLRRRRLLRQKPVASRYVRSGSGLCQKEPVRCYVREGAPRRSRAQKFRRPPPQSTRWPARGCSGSTRVWDTLHASCTPAIFLARACTGLVSQWLYRVGLLRSARLGAGTCTLRGRRPRGVPPSPPSPHPAPCSPRSVIQSGEVSCLCARCDGGAHPDLIRVCAPELTPSLTDNITGRCQPPPPPTRYHTARLRVAYTFGFGGTFE